MNKYTLTGLSIAGGILSGLAWTDWCSGLILLVGFVPFLFVENYIYQHKMHFSHNASFLYLLPGFVVFTLITTGWIRVISLIAAIFVILSVAFLMSFIIWISHFVKISTDELTGYLSMAVFWLGFEFLCTKIDFLSPWINLGNGLSKDTFFIQWYDITGVAGGTLWIILSNIFLTVFLIKWQVNRKISVLSFFLWLLIIMGPSVFSLHRFNRIMSENKGETEVVIVQPNFDPYTEKFTIPFDVQLEKTIRLAESAITDKTTWIVTPETTVDDPVDEMNLNDNRYFIMLRELIRRHPQSAIVAGIVTTKTCGNSTKDNLQNETYSKIHPKKEIRYNSAIKIDTSERAQIYHKSKLVPGFEMIPSGKLFRIIKNLFPEPGRKNWVYGIQKNRTCFSNVNDFYKIAPVICYESVFGEFITGYIKEGANTIFIITNDGWWKGTNGYKQHLSYSSLRAIETRRPVVRAANTGISCIIDIKGQITSSTEWWERTVLKGVIVPGTLITPYVKYGDVIFRLSSIISLIILFVVFLIRPIIKKLIKS